MATLAQWLVVLSGIWLMAVGTLMFVRPQTAAHYVGRAASTNFINYLELTLRGIWGVALVQSADSSRSPEFLLMFGRLIVITTAILFFVPRKWHAQYAVWWSRKLTALHLRIAAPVAWAFGLFLIYVVV